MGAVDYWYVFFIKTNCELEASKEIISSFSLDEAKPLHFSVESHFKKQGEVLRENKVMFPGYLFISSPLANDEFILRVQECIRKSRTIIRLLCYGNSMQASIKLEERKWLEALFRKKQNLEVSYGFIYGERVCITSGPLVGHESIIKQVRRHKMQAVIELELMGSLRNITVGLEILERIN